MPTLAVTGPSVKLWSPEDPDRQAQLLEFLRRTYLSEPERQILRAFRHRDDVLAGKHVARRTGIKYCGPLRSLLARMVERGVLGRGPDGYFVADDFVFEVANDE